MQTWPIRLMRGWHQTCLTVIASLIRRNQSPTSHAVKRLCGQVTQTRYQVRRITMQRHGRLSLRRCSLSDKRKHAWKRNQGRLRKEWKLNCWTLKSTPLNQKWVYWSNCQKSQMRIPREAGKIHFGERGLIGIATNWSYIAPREKRCRKQQPHSLKIGFAV